MKASLNFYKTALALLLLINIALIGFLVYFVKNQDNLNEISATRINFKDSTGKNRVVISNQDLIPPPIIKGKSYERKINPAGIIFYDENGDERGGIAISKFDKMNFNAIAFDYQNADAIGMFAQDDVENSYFKAGLVINDKALSGKPGHNINRINLHTENGNASLVINDANEVPRLVLAVDSLGNPSIEMFDQSGNKQQYVLKTGSKAVK